VLAAGVATAVYAITAWLAWDSSRGFGSVVDWGWSFIRVESCGNCAILVFDQEAWKRIWIIVFLVENVMMFSIIQARGSKGQGQADDVPVRDRGLT